MTEPVQIGPDVMTPANDRWAEFLALLEGPKGCNFRETIPGDADSISWSCGGGNDQHLARELLFGMGLNQVAVYDSCDYFRSQGGYCDCEIVFNLRKSA